MNGNMYYNYPGQAFGNYHMAGFNRPNILFNYQTPGNGLMNSMQVPQFPVPGVPLTYYPPGIHQNEVPRVPGPNDPMMQTFNVNGYEEGYNGTTYGYGDNSAANEPHRRYILHRGQRLYQAVVKVNKINKDTTWRDFKNLVRTWGPTYKIHLAKERISNKGRGYGYVHYKYRSDATRAIEGMNGLSFDNTILEAEWSKHSLNVEQS